MHTHDTGVAFPLERDPSTPTYLICILDRSGSMGIEDYPPTRLLAGIRAIEAALDEKIKYRPQDKIGIVAFSEKSRCICPFTDVADRQKIVQSLKNLHPLSTTDFVKGLNTARKMFEEEVGIRRQVPSLLRKLLLMPSEAGMPKQRTTTLKLHAALISDGAHTEKSDPILAAEKLREIGVVLECIGIGGSPKDVDEECLKAMASTGPDGKPRYRFIGDTHALIQDFRRMAVLQII